MNIKIVTPLVAFLAVGILIFYLSTGEQYDNSITSPNPLEQMVNQERVNNRLPVLSSSTDLRTSACAKAKDMTEKSYFDHISPDGIEPWVNFQEVGYEYQYAGENLARGYTSDDTLVQAWMVSPAHRENILGDFEQQGICTAGKYTVQHLGTRK